MPEFLIKLLTAPHFADDVEKSRRAELLYIFSWTTVALVSFYLLAGAIVGGHTIARIALLAVFIPLHSVVLWLMRRGRVRLSSWLYCIVLFVVLFTYAAFDPRSRGLALDSLVLVVMAAGLLLEFGAGWVMAVASVFVNAVLWYAVTRGILPGPLIERDFFSFVVMHFVLVSAALFVLFMATKSLERASEACIAHRLEIERVVSQISANSALERKRAEAALRVRESALASAINAVAIAGLDAKLTYVNKAFLTMWGYAEYADVLGRSVTEFWNRPEQAGAVVTEILAGGQWMGEFVGKCADDELFDAQVSASAILDDCGAVLGLMASFIDITERNHMERLLRVSLREKELLLQEVHHRVNNNMQIINSLLHIQASHVSNDAARAALRQSQDRIRSMALVHEKLYRSADLDKIYVREYVRSLISHLFQSYEVDSEEMDLHLDIADDVVLSITVAIPCCLILTELLSNVLQHAFPPAWSPLQERACVRVALASEDSRQVLIVSDNGIGLSTETDFKDATSVGLQLVQLWVDQIDGNLYVEHTNGTTVRIIFTNSV